ANRRRTRHSCASGPTATRSRSFGHAPFAPPPANGQQTARGSSPAAVAHHETRAGQRRRPPAPLASVLQSVVPSIAPFRGLIPRKDCHQNALQRARPRETVELEFPLDFKMIQRGERIRLQKLKSSSSA